jgi:hypothetical protein
MFEFDGWGGGALKSTPGTPSGKSGLRAPGSGVCLSSNGFNLSNVSHPAIANAIIKQKKAGMIQPTRDMQNPIGLL